MMNKLLLSGVVASSMLLVACGSDNVGNKRTYLPTPKTNQQAQTKPMADNQASQQQSGASVSTTPGETSTPITSHDTSTTNAGTLTSRPIAISVGSTTPNLGVATGGSVSSSQTSHSGVTPPTTTPPPTAPAGAVVNVSSSAGANSWPVSGGTSTTAGGRPTATNGGATNTGGTASNGGTSGSQTSHSGVTPPTTTPPPTAPTTPSTSTPNVKPKPKADMVILGGLKSAFQKEADKHNMNLDDLSVTIAGKTYADAKNINLNTFDSGFSRHDYHEVYHISRKSDSGKKIKLEGKGKFYIFQQQYSAFAARLEKEWIKAEDGKQPNVTKYDNGKGEFKFYFAGKPTAALPSVGSYQYQGKSHIHRDIKGVPEEQEWVAGEFNYTVDFGAKTGKGQVVEQGNHVIDLQSAPIAKYDFVNGDKTSIAMFGVQKGTAQSNQSAKMGEYTLGIFGDNADEVIGRLEVGDYAGVMGGAKK